VVGPLADHGSAPLARRGHRHGPGLPPPPRPRQHHCGSADRTTPARL